jgi:FG-GAP-like repeat/FG-GAP repeat
MKKDAIRALVLCVLAFPALSRSASAQILYGAESGANSPLYIVQPTTGQVAAIGNIGFGVSALAVHPGTGVLYGVTAQAAADIFTRSLIRIDRTTGAGTLIGPIGLGFGGVADMAFRADGTLFGWSESTDDLITIDINTGAGTIVGNANISTRGSGLAFDSSGTLYLAGNNANGPLRTVDTATGLTTVVATLNGSPAPTQPIASMKFRPGTNVIYATNRILLQFQPGGPATNLVTINPVTGLITNIGPTAPGLDALAWGLSGGGCDVNGDGRDEIVTGAGSGGGPHVRVLSLTTGADLASFYAYEPRFGGGVSVACGDVDGDGKADIITGAGPSAGPHVLAVSGADLRVLHSFYAYDPFFTGGVNVAAGDVNGDGRADIITGAGPGDGPHVRVFDGVTLMPIASFFAYDPAFRGGVFVAAGDVNADGRADIITGAGAGGGPHVAAFSGADLSVLASFFAYSPVFNGGVSVAAGDVNGDGKADIITGAGPGGGPHVLAFSGADLSVLHSFFAYAPFFIGGVNVAAADVNGDGRTDMVTGAGQGGGPHVRVFDGGTGAEVASFFAYAPTFNGGVFVGAANLSREGVGDIIAGAGLGGRTGERPGSPPPTPRGAPPAMASAPSRSLPILSRAPPMTVSAGRNSASSRSPASVVATLPVVRASSRTPT